MSRPTVALRPRSLALTLFSVMGILVFMHCVVMAIRFTTGNKEISGLFPLFDLDGEKNAPTFFSAFIMILAFLQLWFLTRLEKTNRPDRVRYWAILGLGFLLMALDELAALHEHLNEPIHRLMGGNESGIMKFAWTIPGLAVVIAVVLLFLKFWWNLPKNVRLYFLIAAITFVGGAVGFEMIGSVFADHYGRDNIPYTALYTVEETMEFTGVILFNWALMTYVTQTQPEVLLQFGNTKSADS